MNTNIAESARELSEGRGMFSNNYQFDWVFENVWYWIHFYFNTIFAVSYIGLVVLWKEICAGNVTVVV